MNFEKQKEDSEFKIGEKIYFLVDISTETRKMAIMKLFGCEEDLSWKVVIETYWVILDIKRKKEWPEEIICDFWWTKIIFRKPLKSSWCVSFFRYRWRYWRSYWKE